MKGEKYSWKYGILSILTLSEPAFFWVSHEPGGGADTAPPWYLSSEASEEIGAKHNYCDDFSDDYFEVYNISVAQNLTILEPIMRFC